MAAEPLGGSGVPMSSPPTSSSPSTRPLLQIAPMLDVTYRDFRYFMRLLTRRAQLWTEMVVDDTVLFNLEPSKCDKFLGFDAVEHPVVCQLGGSDPSKLAEVAQVVERYGYDEVNLNVGCPSNRVSKGEFGCSLMKRKEVVRDIVHAMSRAVQIPVTVKCRLGVDEFDSQDFTREFVSTVAAGGCKHFIVHARKAWLKGLSPAQNRSVPPLCYGRVLDLCRSFPDLSFSLNGGVADLGHARALLGFPGARLDGEEDRLVGLAWGSPGETMVPPNLVGAMIGRGAMNNPMMLWDADQALYGEPRRGNRPTRRSVLDTYRSYLEEMYPPDEGVRPVGCLHLALKPTLGAFAGMRGNKAFRAAMDTALRRKENRPLGPAHILGEALKAVEEANPGIFNEPLQPASVYSEQVAEASAAAAAAAAATDAPRGRKRKGAAGGDAGGPVEGELAPDAIDEAPAKVCRALGEAAPAAVEVA